MKKLAQTVGIVVAFVWVAVLGRMAVTGITQDDARLAWGVGEDIITYEVSYVWLIDEKKFEPYVVPANELSSSAIDYLSPGEEHRMVYGVGALKSMVEEYVTYIATKQTIYRPRISIGAGGLVTYHLNGEELERRFTFQHIPNEE